MMRNYPHKLTRNVFARVSKREKVFLSFLIPATEKCDDNEESFYFYLASCNAVRKKMRENQINGREMSDKVTCF